MKSCRFGESTALGSVKYRLLCQLYHLAMRHGKKRGDWQVIPIELIHRDLAAMIGSKRETAAAVLNDLIKEGFVKNEKRLFFKRGSCFVYLAAASHFLTCF
ncbi:Crp/Fnr family transcriptional regulator [Bacillus luteus]|uniref:Crp/Fnr family transcriptional regulator n=1 Tax=Alkalicoccus luteus TaxID=1237094 RepID=A0A969TTP5_9BACI|nr:Crp/Fnr family transcriptional regulator [Alkalicoccus luteus]